MQWRWQCKRTLNHMHKAWYILFKFQNRTTKQTNKTNLTNTSIYKYFKVHLIYWLQIQIEKLYLSIARAASFAKKQRVVRTVQWTKYHSLFFLFNLKKKKKAVHALFFWFRFLWWTRLSDHFSHIFEPLVLRAACFLFHVWAPVPLWCHLGLPGFHIPAQPWKQSK